MSNVTAVVKDSDIELSWQPAQHKTAITYSFGVNTSLTGDDWVRYKKNIPVSKGTTLLMTNMDQGTYHIQVVSNGAFAISKPSSTVIVTVEAGRL